MATKVVLPEKYYLQHFFEFLEFLETHYSEILEDQHQCFINEFRDLSEDAQCAYIRMVNRKGSIFSSKNFSKYVEIKNIQLVIAELAARNFVTSLNQDHSAELVVFLTKPVLRKWLVSHDIKLPSEISRDDLVEKALLHLHQLKREKLPSVGDLIVQGRTQTIEYLFFLYFGNIQKTLTLYTLRDLGIRQSQTLKAEFKPRFSDRLEAKAAYFFARNLDQDLGSLSLEQLMELLQKSKEFENLTGPTQHLKDLLLFQVGERALLLCDDLAMAAFSESRHLSARERMARHMYKVGDRDSCQKLLDEMLLDPRGTEEILFAEDFSARKFGKKKVGSLTELLRESREISLSEFYLKKPEAGVCHHYEKINQKASFSENWLWVSLFGIFFWKELFESEAAPIHNPFERSPSDLVGLDFYRRAQESIESQLSLLSNAEVASAYIKNIISENEGRLNDIFQWHPSLCETLVRFVQLSVNKNLAHVLRCMAKNFESCHSGFPDLMVEIDNEIHFIEVKAEGDALRPNQFARLRLLQEAGYSVEVLRIKWAADPDQTYVVIDVETTGGSGPQHRVTEVGAVKIQNGRIIDEFQSLINPERSIPWFITNITGITNDMVAEAPVFSEIAERLYEFIGPSIFVAHNVKFDYGFIQREFERAGIEFVRPQMCTCTGMRKAFPGLKSYGLKNLTEHFKIQLVNHHRALADAQAAAQLFLLMKGTATAAPDRSAPAHTAALISLQNPQWSL